MKRKHILFWTDVLALLFLLGLGITGFIVKFILPPGTGARHHEPSEHTRYLLGWGRHDWGDLHFVMAVIFVILMVIHIWLHWEWIINYFNSTQNNSERSEGTQ